jgi:hypothetical protein
MWPAARFSSDVNVAKRALINRLGSSNVLVCG